MSANPCELELWIHFSFSSSVKFYAIKSFFLDLNIFCTNNTLKMQQSRVFVTWKFPCDQQIYFVGWRKSADKKFHISYLRLRGDNQYWMSTFSGLTLRWTKPLQNILLLKNIFVVLIVTSLHLISQYSISCKTKFVWNKNNYDGDDSWWWLTVM